MQTVTSKGMDHFGRVHKMLQIYCCLHHEHMKMEAALTADDDFCMDNAVLCLEISSKGEGGGKLEEGARNQGGKARCNSLNDLEVI